MNSNDFEVAKSICVIAFLTLQF